MDIKTIWTYTATLTELELSALHELLGKLSYNDRKKLGLTDCENDSMSSMYHDIDAAIDDS